MKLVALFAVLLAAGCDTETDRELASLRAQIEQQQEQIDRLSAFVDSQAEVLIVCQNVMVGFADYVVNSNAIGMLRGAGSQFDKLEECTDAMSAFNSAAAARSKQQNLGSSSETPTHKSGR